MVQEALAWLREGLNVGEAEQELVRALSRSLQLLSARLQLDGQPAPLHAGPLIAPWAATTFDDKEPDQPAAIQRCLTTCIPQAERISPFASCSPLLAFRFTQSQEKQKGGMLTCVHRDRSLSASSGGQAAAVLRHAAGEENGEEGSAAEAALAALREILGTPGPKEITAAVRAQLEQGNVVRNFPPLQISLALA